MKLLPDNDNPATKNSEFDETSEPEGLLHNHQTKANVWVKIVVLEGKLKDIVHKSKDQTYVLDVNKCGEVESVVRHEVKPLGSVRFYVQFFE